MAAQAKKSGGFWNFMDRIPGDKVIWIIVIVLMLLSTVTIFSSTTYLVRNDVTRLDIFKTQMFIVAAGFAIIVVCCAIPKIWVYRFFSQFGFLLSAVLLTMLILGINVDTRNSASRAIKLGGFQLNVYEVVKVAMVMYLSWAIHAYKTGELRLANFLSKKVKWLKWMSKKHWQRIIYIYLPMIITCAEILVGGFSSMVIIGGIMFLTIMIGGVPWKDIGLLALAAIVGLGCAYGTFKISDGKYFKRFGTVEGRIERFREGGETIEELKDGTAEFKDYVDTRRQPESAKVAIKEGGLLGKGPGKSTQKYTVPLIFSDYMYSFIIEEYGLLTGILVIILYVSLLARGSIIARNCENPFAKTAVAGLTLLISGQAMLHMYINLDMGPLTGQTLPLISHGNSSFLCFCVAFGILLSISRMTQKRIDTLSNNLEPLVEGGQTQDDMSDNSTKGNE